MCIGPILYNRHMKLTLAHVLLEVEDVLADHTDLLYRVQGSASCKDDNALQFSGTVDFLTYFNALPLAKWRQYTGIPCAYLEFWASSTIRLQLCCVHAESLGLHAKAQVAYMNVCLDECRQDVCGNNGLSLYRVNIPLNDAVLVGFSVSSTEEAIIRGACYTTEVDENAINPVHLALATTTFNNEDYILPNIRAIQKQILQGSDAIADAFHLFVVDNGRTLDTQTLQAAGIAVGASDELGRMHAPGITVCPNPNVGGSGGFARGMMEALGWMDESAAPADVPYTHVLLMDDDVHISTESIKRTFSLLRLAKGVYRDSFVNGAMLKRAEPNIQFEDVSYARASGGYERFKPTLDVAQLDDLVRNETISVEDTGAYGAWWYSCIPASAIRAHGLPLPFFVRGDDVEYGVRCQATYMTMNGICVWHDHFVGRFRASVDGYQYARNLLIIAAIHESIRLQGFMARIWRVFHIYLRSMNYDAADLWLDALEDYLRGPDWLAHADGAAIMKENAAKNEKLVPVSQLDNQVMGQLTIDKSVLGHDESPRSALSKLLESVPHDRHWFPDVLLRKEPAIIDYSGNLGPWQDVAMRRTLVALDSEGKNGHIRTLDRKRYKDLVSRYRALQSDMRARGQSVQQAWKDAFPYLTSQEFWRGYLLDR